MVKPNEVVVRKITAEERQCISPKARRVSLWNVRTIQRRECFGTSDDDVIFSDDVILSSMMACDVAITGEEAAERALQQDPRDREPLLLAQRKPHAPCEYVKSNEVGAMCVVDVCMCTCEVTNEGVVR